MKRYMSTTEKAEQLKMTHQGLEKAIKSGRIEPDALIGRVKGFESDNQIKPKKERGLKKKD